MAWTAPVTWVNGQQIDPSDFNQELRDNMMELKDPPSDNHEVDEASDYTTTSTSWAGVDPTDLTMTITTTGGDVIVGFMASVDNNTAGERVHFDVLQNSVVRFADDDGICVFEMPFGTASRPQVVSFVYLRTGLAADIYTFRLQWKVSGGTAKMYAGAGTSGYDVHPQFWAREVS